jgi:phosphoglycolate phosphatase-like HAD superfamily hydrolase
MIQAIIFDLDGTLVQTERLKAISYARAAIELCPRVLTEAEVIEGFKAVFAQKAERPTFDALRLQPSGGTHYQNAFLARRGTV